MKTPYTQVASALDAYYKGNSINDICDTSLTTGGNRLSSKTVYSWITKYTDEAVNQFKDYHPSVGDIWVADETVLRLDGKNVWCIDIIDEDTRYLLATKLSANRETKDIKELLEKARGRAGKIPKRVLTDGWRGYLDGMELAFGADSKHIITDPFGEEDNTEIIERWHSTLKERTKTLRGLKSVETANKFLDGFLIFYNYLRPHETLSGKTPAEQARVDYKTKSWVDIIRYAKPHIQVLTTPAKVDILSERKLLVRPITHRTYNVENRRAQRIQHKRAQARISRKTPRITKPMPQLGGIR
jgi:transposase-like protein